jgi:hypothetical protein
MNVWTKLFTKIRKVLHVPDEDEGYNDHLVGQKNPPFYCGTAFCGHATKKAARECWQRKMVLAAEINSKFKELMAQGKKDEAWEYLKSTEPILYPEDDPANWPINRPSAAMRQEYLKRAERES